MHRYPPRTGVCHRNSPAVFAGSWESIIIPMHPHRALIATSGSMDHVDRSSYTIIAPLHKSLLHMGTSWTRYSLVKVQLRMMGLYSRELRDDATHDMRICTSQRFAYPQKKIHLRWSQPLFWWFKPVSNLYSSTITAFWNDGIRQWQYINFIAHSALADLELRRQICYCHMAATAQGMPDSLSPFVDAHAVASFCNDQINFQSVEIKDTLKIFLIFFDGESICRRFDWGHDCSDVERHYSTSHKKKSHCM